MTGARYEVSEEWTLEALVRLFERFRGVQGVRDRMEWSYLRNPAGEPRVWTLRTSSGEEIAFTACHPRQVWVAGHRHTALVGGDFSVDPRHRTLGPAVKLRRAVTRLVERGVYPFVYSHPVPAMLAVHRRVGHPQIGTMARWAFPLRARRALEARVGAGPVTVLAPAADALLWARRHWARSGRPGVQVRQVQGFDEEYDELDRALGESYPVVGGRDRAYLTWRFLRRPKLWPSVLEARDRRGRLTGFLVLEATSPLAVVHDAAFLPNTGTEDALLLDAAQRAAEASADSLSLSLLSGSVAERRLGKLGFLRRSDRQAVVCYAGSGFSGKSLVEDPASWFMTAGDRDV